MEEELKKLLMESWFSKKFHYLPSALARLKGRREDLHKDAHVKVDAEGEQGDDVAAVAVGMRFQRLQENAKCLCGKKNTKNITDLCSIIHPFLLTISWQNLALRGTAPYLA